MNNKRGLVTRGLRGAVVVCCLVGILASGGSSSAAGKTRIPGTWMAGPGCGGAGEWFQHPAEFPYFCDGAAYVEEAHWENWGAAKARATATMNEAVLNSHNNVGTAPRSLSPVTVIASHIRSCGGRRVYKSVVIRFENPGKGQPKTLNANGLQICP